LSLGVDQLIAPTGSRPPVLSASSRRLGDRTFRSVALASGLLVLVVLAGIVASTLVQAWPAIQHEGLRFITSKTWDLNGGRFGGLALIYGTLVTSAIAVVVAVPVSLGIALFFTEVAPRRARPAIIFVMDLLAAVPSVVFGLWGFETLAPPIGRLYGHISNALDGVPVLGALFHGNQGRSYMTAGLIVALMITPIITSLAREVFSTVPATQKEAALALGSTRWEMIRVSVLSHSRSGVIGAVMLGLGRAMGETIAVALVIGSIQRMSIHLFQSGDALASVIANQFGEAFNSTGNPQQDALIGLGLALFVLTIVVNSLARWIISRNPHAEAAR
jgi:phosphate transport system permease protein